MLSRKNDFYYGNPQNRFWRVLAGFVKAPVPESIPEKKELLLSCGIALWDVIQECDIKGSSDASIKNVVPAQVERIIRAAPIKRVICNGATAARLYKSTSYIKWESRQRCCRLPAPRMRRGVSIV